MSDCKDHGEDERPWMCSCTARKLSELHRRAQAAEGIIARSGIVEGRPQMAEGRSMGRALANYAAAKYERERDEALRLLHRFHDCLKRGGYGSDEYAELMEQIESSNNSLHAPEAPSGSVQGVVRKEEG